MNKDVERARVVSAGVDGHVQSAFSFDVFKPHSPQALCQLIGLNWVSLMDLQQKGLLSFDPRELSSLSRAQEAEMRFLGRLVVAGCCGNVLSALLSGLKQPYAYNLDRMYYDWTHRQWRLLEDTEHLETHLEEWLDELVAWGDLRVLQQIQKLVDESVTELESRQRGAESRFSPVLVMRGAGEGL
ncbi:MAG: hypothetical protein K8T26_13080 [Lentisphaerae bacterium]|nr:hypothetical protein [Lentisphaerota bacterium]